MLVYLSLGSLYETKLIQKVNDSVGMNSTFASSRIEQGNIFWNKILPRTIYWKVPSAELGTKRCKETIYCKTKCTFRRHNNSINITNTINMLHVSALLSHHQAYTSRTIFFQFCITVFWAIALGIPFALQIIIIVCMVLGVHCCS